MQIMKITVRKPNGDEWNDFRLVKGFDLNRYKKWYFNEVVNVVTVDACGYNTGCGWSSVCCGNEKPCAEHTAKCFCGEKARAGCSSAGSLVCGRPVCGKKHFYCQNHGG